MTKSAGLPHQNAPRSDAASGKDDSGIVGSILTIICIFVTVTAVVYIEPSSDAQTSSRAGLGIIHHVTVTDNHFITIIECLGHKKNVAVVETAPTRFWPTALIGTNVEMAC
ncbi:MAG: hypothetical protein G01um1014107_263, partial [Parcubacteria group bacterium Gr01-1014_107]